MITEFRTHIGFVVFMIGAAVVYHVVFSDGIKFR